MSPSPPESSDAAHKDSGAPSATPSPPQDEASLQKDEPVPTTDSKSASEMNVDDSLTGEQTNSNPPTSPREISGLDNGAQKTPELPEKVQRFLFASEDPAEHLRAESRPENLAGIMPPIVEEDASEDLNNAAELTGDLMEITDYPEIIDLTDDAPYNGPRFPPTKRIVKQEPADISTMVTEEHNDTTAQHETATMGLDDMEVDENPKDKYALPELTGGDDFWQFDEQDRAKETENTMAMIEAAAQTFRSSLPMSTSNSREDAFGRDVAMEDFASLDSDAEDAEAVSKFADLRKLYRSKKKTGMLDFADDIEYKRAIQAEEERKRRRARNKARHISPQLDDESMFFPDNGRRSPTTVDAEDEILANIMREQTPDSEPSRFVAGKGKKSRAKGPTAPKAGVRKAKINRPKATNKRGRKPSTMDFDSLFSNNLIATAQENQKKEDQPALTSRIKAVALSDLISSMPKEQQKLHGIDARELEKATKKFNGRGVMKADPVSGGWKLNGMRSSLHHYQLLGAAFMRDLENRTRKPFGGFVADEMGLGKTVMAIANILDGVPNPKSQAKATLVVAPSSLLSQWMSEIEKHTEPGKMGSVLLYRTRSSLMANDVEGFLSRMGVVITSYNEVLRSWPKNDPPPHLCTNTAKVEWWADQSKNNIGPLHRVTWRRVILDEAQAIKNYLSRTSEAVCQLKSKYRWAISGTPIQNRLEEFYAFFVSVWRPPCTYFADQPYQRFLDLPHTGNYDTFRKNFCKRDCNSIWTHSC